MAGALPCACAAPVTAIAIKEAVPSKSAECNARARVCTGVIVLPPAIALPRSARLCPQIRHLRLIACAILDTRVLYKLFFKVTTPAGQRQYEPTRPRSFSNG